MVAPSNPPGYISMRAFNSDAQRNTMMQRAERAWGHNQPESVIVMAMGNHWMPGSWQKVTDMVMATNNAGIYCGFQELQDRCLNWGDALGTMRNEGLLVAKNEGFEWVCWVDNDVMPEPDMLIKLLARRVSVIAPFVAEPGNGRPLHGPICQPGTGLHPVKWTVLSLLLMRTNVFNATGPKFWSDALGADEGFHFQLLWHYGHQPYLDTDSPMVVSKAPTYPLASNRLDWDERSKYWQQQRQRLMRAPDRRPIDPDDGNERGEYMPFTARGQSGDEQPVSAAIPLGLVPESIATDWNGDDW